ncbi:hypothetical protein EEL32_22345 [Brevibacillus laterosporus]|uniref:Uncharacterized protein n=1 Tax=Brevibacillus laterosporus TaxID=1465 RepID=A0A502HWF2_BRELA|nr:CD1247 N-terminal domain-containing protein [Brevibacillus laterosporus]QDX93542.1 hypothetical protein EEL30_15325 [Brevibacillus laterosporus]RAP30547.1 hypothetical protein C2W64_01743 [Brevibacillus laterosporus]TPG73289.1 hypothetical protein EEL31_02670 [Brevibacillus laterosporus]TPG77672.1 hypothetical protein EEL32_22345 [Brevibacillus laterosporus]
MEHVEQHLAYLQGLVEGLDPEQAGLEGKALFSLVQLCDDLIAELRTVHVRVEECEQYIEAVDEDLTDLEYLLYDDEEIYETVHEDYQEAMSYREQFSDLDDSDEAYYYEALHTTDRKGIVQHVHELECPQCREVLMIKEEVDPEGYHSYEITNRFHRDILNPS